MWHDWGRRELHTEFLMGKLKEKRPLRRPRLRWEDNIKMERKEIESEGVDWNYLTEDRKR
jgi:hypothetical protein